MCLVLVEMHVSAAAPFAPSFKKVSTILCTQPMKSHDVMTNAAAVSELCKAQATKYEQMHHELHAVHAESVDHRRFLVEEIVASCADGNAKTCESYVLDPHGHALSCLWNAETEVCFPADHSPAAEEETLVELDCEVLWCKYNHTAIQHNEIVSPLCVPDCEVTGACQQKLEHGCTVATYTDESSGDEKDIADEATCVAHGGAWADNDFLCKQLQHNGAGLRLKFADRLCYSRQLSRNAQLGEGTDASRCVFCPL